MFPGFPKIQAALETPEGAAINKELTVYVGDTDSNAKLVATVKTSGGAGSPYSYTGRRLGGDNTTLLVGSSNGEISVPAGFVVVTTPGTNFQLEVAVDDDGQGATTPAKVTLTLQYIKTSGPLTTTTEIATSPIADTAKTVFYHPKGESLAAALNVANIQPSGGIPPYIFEVQGNTSRYRLDYQRNGKHQIGAVEERRDSFGGDGGSAAADDYRESFRHRRHGE